MCAFGYLGRVIVLLYVEMVVMSHSRSILLHVPYIDHGFVDESPGKTHCDLWLVVQNIYCLLEKGFIGKYSYFK